MATPSASAAAPSASAAAPSASATLPSASATLPSASAAASAYVESRRDEQAVRCGAVGRTDGRTGVMYCDAGASFCC
jgi:uncharacterized protein YfaQ (DUF2300 family)